jgi:hypothetical protein
VCWSASEDFVLASGASDGAVLLWDLRRARTRLASLIASDAAPAGGGGTGRAHAGRIRGLLFADGGRRLLSYGGDGRVRVWDAARRAAVDVNLGPFPGSARGEYAPVHMAARPGGDAVCIPRGREVRRGLKEAARVFNPTEGAPSSLRELQRGTPRPPGERSEAREVRQASLPDSEALNEASQKRSP